MPRFKLTVEYDGTPFVGWQRQENGPSVQALIEDAVLAFAGEDRRLQAAGRTDAGVHALGQVAHVDLEKDWPEGTVRDALNAHLRPHPIAILSAERVGDDFEARFSAREREYLYRIVTRRAPLALEANRAWHINHALDADAMHAAADRLIGRHDFTTFRAAQCQAKSPVKTLDQLEVFSRGDEIHVTARARSFLHHQVRSMVGTLKKVGEGAWTPADVAAALAAKDRASCGPMAPSCGLYLVRVGY
ncbi:MAG: tRNA pseudouridine(38-40) synthase TruA [Alphaproteobacteria bacterium]|nr:tRNA pseudouridine(38-40) synthase TruA [Alphaproteobacteria bacterium]